mmetsp:Transcript_31431/g.36241  ORF Transcript_31431/g.36241 Transcript_31431/m.36241 type:complete len:84 (+) Transcript_31431:557-808(+)
MEEYSNIWNSCGTIVSGSGKQGYNVKLDDLPTNCQIVSVQKRNFMTVVDKNDEEIECDHANRDLEVVANLSKKKVNRQTKSQK